MGEAISHCTRVLELEPDYSAAIHMLSALTGNTTGGVPQDYVTHLFENG